jgi:Tol biopolymer transport system component
MRPEVGSPSLWLRRLDDPEERRFVPRGNVSLFLGAVFSPDGNSIAFGNGTGIWKIPLEGGPPFPLAPRAGFGIDWSDDDWIYVSVTSGGNLGGSIQRLRPAGGALQELAAPHLARGETSYDFPHALPDRQALLFNIYRRGRGDRSPIALLDLETGAVQQLGLEGGQPRYLPTGHILYGRDDALWAVPFNVATGQVTGDPRIVQRRVGVVRISGSVEATVSDTGTLVYVEAPPSRAHRLVVLDHAGNERILREEPGGLHMPRFSPDGERVVAADDNESPWIYELSQRSWAPVAAEGSFTTYAWADDQTITYSAGTALFSQRIDGRGRPQELWKSEHLLGPLDWSPDGTMLAFEEKSPETGADIWLLKIEEGGTRRAAPFRNTEHDEGDARFSPDGQWIAYNSNEHGSLQVYLTSVSQPSSHYPVSGSSQTTAPMWSPDSRRLYFRLGLNMMVVDVDTRDGVSIGEPRILFELARSYFTGYVPSFDISPDGETFITIDTELHVPRTLRVVVDWFEHVRRQFQPGG